MKYCFVDYDIPDGLDAYDVTVSYERTLRYLREIGPCKEPSSWIKQGLPVETLCQFIRLGIITKDGMLTVKGTIISEFFKYHFIKDKELNMRDVETFYPQSNKMREIAEEV